MSACEKTDPAPEDPIQNGGSANAEIIASHLIFSNATKITGTVPKGPAGSSLKISIEDTLFLVDKYRVPVKFLHEDTTKNVAGVYARIYVGSLGSTFYYDVPEVPDIATNDTVSVVLISIDRDGLLDDLGVPPAGPSSTDIPFEITFVPYDETGNPTGEVTVPVHISKSDTDLSGECGLVNGTGEYWVWSASYISDPNDPNKDFFFNSRDKLWGLTGQLIQGCCTNGISAYTANCLDENKKKLRFRTFFNWPTELYQFRDDGTYSGISEFISADPDPPSSDFCGVRDGVVHEDFDRRFLEGTWQVTAAADLQTLGTSTPSGDSRAARPDGKITLLDCDYLITEQLNAEGGNQALVQLYIRWDSQEPNWFPLE